MRPILLVALALVAAGCVSAPLQTSSVVPQAAAVPSLSQLVSVIDPAGGQGEPSMGFAPDGTVYANGLDTPGPSNNPGAVYKSTDDGATWKRIAAPTAPMPNEDPDLAVAKDGTVWFSSLWVGCSSTASSKDAGKSWTTSYLGCVPAAGDRQYLIPTKGGTAYIYSHHVPTFYQAVAKTTDYGATWTPSGFAEGPLAIAQAGQSGWGGGGFWNEKTGSVWATFTWFTDLVAAQVGTSTTAWTPAAGVTRDEGKTWQLVQAKSAGGAAVGLGLVVGAADSAGNVYLAWAEAKGQQMTVYLAASKDDGKTFSKPIVVDDDAGSKVFPAIAAGDAGHVAVGYYHADVKEYPANAQGAHWNVKLSWTTDALADAPVFEHADLSNKSARTGPVCPDGTLCGTINCPSVVGCSSNRQLLDYFALHAAPDGRVGSVWTSTDEVKGKVVNIFGLTAAPILRAPTSG